MRRSISVLASFGLLLVACGPPAAPPGDFEIRYVRTPSDYSISIPFEITIEASGAMTVDPYPGPERGEIIEDRVSRSDLDKLWSLVRRADRFRTDPTYLTEEDGCRQVWANHGTATIELTADGETHTAHHYLGCRGGGDIERLWNLEETIEQLARIPERRQQWEIQAAIEAKAEEEGEGGESRVIPVD